MSLARFYSRISNAVQPLIGDTAELATFLRDRVVCLEAAAAVDADSSHRAGFLLAVNLCARLYPKLQISAPRALQDQAAQLALAINPLCEIETRKVRPHGSLRWGLAAESAAAVAVSARNWNVLLDQQPTKRLPQTNPLVALAAGAIGTAELFRGLFASFLPEPRLRPQPTTLNLLNPETPKSDGAIGKVNLGTVHLVGAGAVGQAAIHALRNLDVEGTVVIVEDECLSLSNLQRYVLSFDNDVGLPKCNIAARELNSSKLDVQIVEHRWGSDDATSLDAETVWAAVDTAATRIAIQAALPKAIYNAWTQPADLGWSRHEAFGKDPCLACLYLPSGPRPSLHELIARALRQPELRVLAYLTHRVAVGTPLKPEQIPQIPKYPVPADASTWVERPILEDVCRSFAVPADSLAEWTVKQISDMYREGICGGAIVSRNIGELSQEVAVPLAHQSALAGIMLAAQAVIAAVPNLRAQRSTHIENRLNVLSRLQQIVGRPRQRTPGCLCGDDDYRDRYQAKWTNK